MQVHRVLVIGARVNSAAKDQQRYHPVFAFVLPVRSINIADLRHNTKETFCDNYQNRFVEAKARGETFTTSI